jgi:hypothetical protein
MHACIASGFLGFSPITLGKSGAFLRAKKSEIAEPAGLPG